MEGAALKPGFKLPEITANVSPAASILRATEISARPDRHELSARPKTVYNQLSMPCCVSCAMTSAMESLATASPALSPLFHYHVTRFDNHKAEQDGSLLMEDGLNTLRFQ